MIFPIPTYNTNTSPNLALADNTTIKMDPRILLLESLHDRWNTYRAGLKTCQHEFSEEGIHAFRVATRRLMALSDILYSLSQDPQAKKIRRQLKTQLNQLDQLRDVQVLLAGISDNIQKFPALAPFQDYLLHAQKKFTIMAQRDINSLNAYRLQKKICKLEKSLGSLSAVNLKEKMILVVDEAHTRVGQRYTQIDPAQPATLHRLRIAFKRFRYMVEVCHPLIEGFQKEQLKQMQALQALLGDIQDAQVALLVLAAFEKNIPTGYQQEQVHSFFLDRQAQAIANYLKTGDAVISFWRSARNNSFQKEPFLMNLYLIRHAIAVDASDPNYEEDGIRPLTDKGRKKMRLIAKGLRTLGVDFDLILSSPHLRTAETAQILADVFKIKKEVQFSNSLLPEGDPEQFIAEMNEKFSAGSVAIVGHEPFLSSMIGLLVSENGVVDLSLKKGGVCRLLADDLRHERKATIEWLLTPGILVEIAEK